MNDRKLTKKERRALQKREREESQQKAMRHQRNKKILTWTGVAGMAVILILFISVAIQQSAANTPGQEMPDQGREHVQVGDEHEEYNSTPPTSGPHATTARWGKHDEPVAYENQIHNLEHGGIIIHYHPDRIQNLAELETLFDELYKKYPKMVLVPDSNLETTYALTGWRWLDAFDDYDSERIKLFTKKRYNKSPEPNAN